MSEDNSTPGRASSGVDGLDLILGGGFSPDRLFVIQGMPGSGKTTVGLQFLLAGVALGETVLYVTLSETESEVREVVQSHGWSLDGMNLLQLTPDQQLLDADEQYSVFDPVEVELGDATRKILTEVERLRPISTNDKDPHTQSIAHGVVLLEQHVPDYGVQCRRLKVVKLRGSDFQGGFHDYVIRRGGLQVFPRLVASGYDATGDSEKVGSGDAGFDRLLGGGLERGSSTLFMGAAGTGKSSLAMMFAAALARRGERVAAFLFDESVETLLHRCAALGIDIGTPRTDGRMLIRTVDPAELSPGEFVDMVRREVLEQDCRMIVIDSLNGYLNAMPDERFLTIQLHELLSFLARLGVMTLLVNAHQGTFGSLHSRVDASYLADAVILTRFFETPGEVRQAVSVLKKRGGAHERTIRGLHFGADGLRIGEPLTAYRGILTGLPQSAD